MTTTPSACAGPISDPREWLEANTPVVTHAVRQVARRRRLSADDADELLSQVFARLLKDDCHALRAFRGSSSPLTYLVVVAERQLLDLRTARWGRWRPSAAARRQGDAAVAFERLVTRDGVAPPVARAITGHSGEHLVCTRAQSGRHSRRFVSLDQVREHVSQRPNPLDQLLSRDGAADGARLRRRLASALRELGPSDLRLLRMRHADGLPMAQIARTLNVDGRTIYPKMDAIHKRLRTMLIGAGAIASIERRVEQR